MMIELMMVSRKSIVIAMWILLVKSCHNIKFETYTYIYHYHLNVRSIDHLGFHLFPRSLL